MARCLKSPTKRADDSWKCLQIVTINIAMKWSRGTFHCWTGRKAPFGPVLVVLLPRVLHSCYMTLNYVNMITKFLRAITAVPRDVPSVALHFEVGWISVEAWGLTTGYGLFLPPMGLKPLTLTDTFQSKWKGALSDKLLTLEYSPSSWIALGFLKGYIYN